MTFGIIGTGQGVVVDLFYPQITLILTDYGKGYMRIIERSPEGGDVIPGTPYSSLK